MEFWLNVVLYGIAVGWSEVVPATAVYYFVYSCRVHYYSEFKTGLENAQIQTFKNIHIIIQLLFSQQTKL